MYITCLLAQISQSRVPYPTLPYCKASVSSFPQSTQQWLPEKSKTIGSNLEGKPAEQAGEEAVPEIWANSPRHSESSSAAAVRIRGTERCKMEARRSAISYDYDATKYIIVRDWDPRTVILDFIFNIIIVASGTERWCVDFFLVLHPLDWYDGAAGWVVGLYVGWIKRLDEAAEVG